MSKTAVENKVSTKSTDTKGIKKYISNLTQEEKISYGMLAFIILLVMLIRSNFFNIPFERDEGAYGYYGKLLLQGKTPYVDFYEQKFPGIFYFYGAMVGIFGDTVKGLHMGFMFLNIATILFLFGAAKRLFSPMAAVVTAMTYAVVSMTPNLSGFTVQGEHGVAFFTSMGIYFYSITTKDNRWKYFFYMGLAMGLAFMTKTSGMFLGLWGGIAIVVDFFFGMKKSEWTKREFFKRTLVYSAGVFAVIGIFFLIIMIKGSFEQMLYWSIEIPKRYVSRMPWEEGKKYLDYTYQAITKEYKFFWVHAALAAVTLILKNLPFRLKLSTVLLMVFGTITIFPGYYFYGHYWIQILPGLAIMAGLTFYAINDIISNRAGVKSPKVKYIYVAIFFIVSFMHLNRLKDYYFNPNYDRILRTVYGNNPFPETAKIAEFINANSKPEDNIVAIGSEPEIYFYTKKNCPSRHAYFSAIVDSVDEHRKWQREFVGEVTLAKPRYVIFYNHPISLMVQRGVDQFVFQWYDRMIREQYNLIGFVDMIDGYQSNYVWREQLQTYKPQAQNQIYIYERRPDSLFTKTPIPVKK